MLKRFDTNTYNGVFRMYQVDSMVTNGISYVLLTCERKEFDAVLQDQAASFFSHVQATTKYQLHISTKSQ